MGGKRARQQCYANGSCVTNPRRAALRSNEGAATACDVYCSEPLWLDCTPSAMSSNVRLFCRRPANCSRLPLITYNSSSVSFPQLSLIFPLYSFKEPSTQFQFMPHLPSSI